MRTIMTAKEISRWYRNKKVRVWRRALFLLYNEESLSLSDICGIIDADRSGTERQLKKMAIDHWTRRIDHQWHITDTGITKVEHDKKFGSMPTLKWGIYY